MRVDIDKIYVAVALQLHASSANFRSRVAPYASSAKTYADLAKALVKIEKSELISWVMEMASPDLLEKVSSDYKNANEKSDMETEGPKLWNSLHKYCRYWDGNVEAAAQFLAAFKARIPCGECKDHWASLCSIFPPDLSSKESLFAWSVDAHNKVNQRLNKPVMSMEDARSMHSVKLTIGMATYDDYDGVYFTIQSLRLYHPACLSDSVEFLVVDNNPKGKHSAAIKLLLAEIPGSRYVGLGDGYGTGYAKNAVFENARGLITLCIDCHVQLESGAIDALLGYFDSKENHKNLLQGPLLYDGLRHISTHFDPTWRGEMYGIWATNQEAYDKGEPFEVKMHGCGLMACVTENWPQFNPMFRGFGAEEGYIHEKFRIRGGKCVCHPKIRWTHRFNRPAGAKYPNILEDRLWNYFVGWIELLGDPKHPFIESIKEHFTGKVNVDHVYKKAVTSILDQKYQPESPLK